MSEARRRVEILGVAHYRVEFADAVRETVRRLEPAAIAVELPSTLESAVLRAVRRLPQLSVVLYTTRSGEAVYLPIEPSDPIVEGVRCGLERGLPVAFVDLDVDEYPEYRDPLPDPWVTTRLGIDAYTEAVGRHPAPRDPLDARREAGMAWRTRRLAEASDGPVLLICGLVHAPGVRRALESALQAEPLARVRREGVSVWNLDPECLPEVLGETPWVAALYESRRAGRLPAAPDPAPLAASRQVGPFRVVGADRASEAEELARAVARAAGRAGARQDGRAGPLDRIRAAAALFEEAALRRRALVGQDVLPWQRRTFARFARRLARASQALVPDLHDLMVAARGCVDENFAYETWCLGRAYPWQRSVADLPTARISGEHLRLGTRRLRLRPRLPRPGRNALAPGLARRRRQRWRGEWLEGFRGEGICSYPPEDLVVEEFGHRMRRRGRALLQEERARSEPFVASLKDGIDARETLRRWHQGELWVREAGRAPHEIGNLVVIFDEDPDGTRYPFLLTWLGEHDAESDMAFYASDPRQAVVGPGICRARHGGFLLSHPPRRMHDVWGDPRYALASSKAERLVLAALDYSLEPGVVMVARRAPTPRMKQWAAQLDRRLVYLPLGQLSPAGQERLRVLHVLDGHSRREIARDYVL